MILSLIDYSIPRICTYVSQPQQWTAANGNIFHSVVCIIKITIWSFLHSEKKFEIICESLVKTQDTIYNQIIYFLDLKRTHPKMVNSN
jgi:hypothetical protein